MPTLIEAHHPRAQLLPVRDQAPKAIGLHTTGRGLTGKAMQAVDAGATIEPSERRAVDKAALAFYTRGSAKFYAGYMVGLSGQIWRLAPDDREAQHAVSLDPRYGSPAWDRWANPMEVEEWIEHKRPPKVVYDWWYARWPGLSSPLRHVTGRHPNATSIGIDLLPDSGGGYTEEQLRACAALVVGLCAEHDIPHDRAHVLGHEDIDPCRRGSVLRDGKVLGVPWDPGTKFRWDALGLGADRG